MIFLEYRAKQLRLSIGSLIIACMFIPTSYVSATRMYLFITPSHEQMFHDYFLPSLQDDYELVIRRFDQTCPSACFMESGWKATVIKKVEMLIDACADPENKGKIFLYSDIDIQFFKPTQQIIFDLMADKTLDIVIQKDHEKGTACTGFLACRASDRTRVFWCYVRDIMLESMNAERPIGDQAAFNILVNLQSTQRHIKWSFLPETFLGPGIIIGERWTPGVELSIPQDIVMHHANWTVGIENKIKQLSYVRSLVLR